MCCPEMVTVEDHAVRPPRRSDTILNIGVCICERRQCSKYESGGRLDGRGGREVGRRGGKVPRSLSCHEDEERRPDMELGEVGEDIV